jgi:hypothetical protein
MQLRKSLFEEGNDNLNLITSESPNSRFNIKRSNMYKPSSSFSPVKRHNNNNYHNDSKKHSNKNSSIHNQFNHSYAINNVNHNFSGHLIEPQNQRTKSSMMGNFNKNNTSTYTNTGTKSKFTRSSHTLKHFDPIKDQLLKSPRYNTNYTTVKNKNSRNPSKTDRNINLQKNVNLNLSKDFNKEIASSIENLKSAYKRYMSSKKTKTDREKLKEMVNKSMKLLKIHTHTHTHSEPRGTFLKPDSDKHTYQISESLNSSFSLDDDSSLMNFNEGVSQTMTMKDKGESTRSALFLNSEEDENSDHEIEIRKSIIKNLEDFNLGKVKEKLERYLRNVYKAGNLSPKVSLCLTPVRKFGDDDDDDDNKDKHSKNKLFFLNIFF